MLVCVTGGTGFVGSHSVAAMTRRGHRVRLLVRAGNEDTRVRRALAPLGVEPGDVEVIVGDVTERAAVDRAMRGADAVLHAASVYSFDSRTHARMRRINERGTELVLAAARRADADPIIHVSTFAALVPGDDRTVTAASPVARPRERYIASKSAAEHIARRHQAEGAPVVITYPPALLGPHDPNLGDQTARLRDVLRGLMPLWPRGGFPLGDVRDTAELHAALLTSPRDGQDRWFGPGRYLSTRRYIETVREVTGRRLPVVFLPARAMLPVGLLVDLVQHAWPWHIPAEYGAVYTCAQAIRVDPERVLHTHTPRETAETFAATVGWLREAGHLTARQAGLADERLPAPSTR
jgi:dihydroflavonol-4-reductase